MEQSAVGARIRLRRKQLNLTQEQLAGLAGLTQAAIAKIERGGATRHLAQIARSLEVSPNWLAYGENDPIRPGQGYWPFTVASLSDLEALSPEKRRELDMRLADFIAGALQTKRTA